MCTTVLPCTLANEFETLTIHLRRLDKLITHLERTYAEPSLILVVLVSLNTVSSKKIFKVQV